VTNTDDQLVAEYLRRLAAAAQSLPADRRDELIEEIRAHIAEARALGPDATGEAATSVADTLARLGEPDDIVQAAADEARPGLGDSGLVEGSPAAGGPASAGINGPGAYGPGGYGPGGYGPGGYGPGGGYPSWPGSYGAPRPAPSGIGAMEICAVILLLIGGFLAGVGWVVGAILLWISPRWRLSDKLLGTLIWPGGVAAVFLVGSGAAFVGGSVSTTACFGGAAARPVSQGPLEQGSQAITQHCTNPAGSIPGWLGLVLLLVAVLIGIGGPVLVAIRLVRQARRAQYTYPTAA
jgi:hypothetical protein